MKFKEILSEVLGPKVGSEKFNEAINSDNPLDYQFEEEEANAIKTKIGGFLTLEAAKSHPEVIETVKNNHAGSVKRSVYSNLDNKVGEIAQSHGVTFEPGANMEAKLEALKQAKAPSDDQVKGITKKYSDLQNEFAAFKQNATQKEEELKNSFAKKESLMLQENFINQNYTFAEHYQDPVVKRGILNAIINNIESGATVNLKDGDFSVTQKDNPELPIFDQNNNQVSYKSLIDSQISKYLKKSEGNKPPGAPPQSPPQRREMNSFQSEMAKRNRDLSKQISQRH